MSPRFDVHDPRPAGGRVRRSSPRWGTVRGLGLVGALLAAVILAPFQSSSGSVSANPALERSPHDAPSPLSDDPSAPASSMEDDEIDDVLVAEMIGLSAGAHPQPARRFFAVAAPRAGHGALPERPPRA